MVDYASGAAFAAAFRSRRRFLQGTAIGAGALLLPRSVMSAAQSTSLSAMMTRAPSEIDLESLKAIDPLLHQVATEAVAHAKYTFAAVAAGETGSGNELADTCRSYITTRKAKSRSTYATKAKELLAAPPEIRNAQFGRFAAIAPATLVASDRKGLQVLTMAPAMTQTTASVAASLRKLALSPAFGPALQDAAEDAAEAAAETAIAKAAKDKADADAAKAAAKAKKNMDDGHKYKFLEFYIKHVKCIDNTGGALEGTDEISLGGNAVGATGVRHKIKPWLVQEGFDIGVTHTYATAKTFFMFDVPIIKPWPHEFMVQVALAELDSGGFGDFLEKLWEKLKVVVSGILSDLGGTIAGATIGSFIPIPGLGTLIGAAIGAFIGWLVSLFHNEDDVVGAKSNRICLHHSSLSYYDKKALTSPGGIPVTLDFHDDGHYQVGGGWRLKKTN